MNDMERTPEEVCWAHSTDSLVFSESPVGPSTSNTHDDSIDVRSRGSDANDDDQPLVGELIWSENNDLAEYKGSSPHYYSTRDQHSSPSTKERVDNFDTSRDFDVNGDCFSFRRWEAGWHREDGDRSNGRSPESVATDERDNHRLFHEDRRDNNVHHGAAPVDQAGGDFHESVWMDDNEDITPARDQGGPEDTSNSTRPGEEQRTSEVQRNLRTNDGNGRSHRALEFDSDSDIYSDGEASELSISDQAQVSLFRRHTKSRLDRERQKLDRLPRSQRLNQVKGHPLGGMTLLELEERNLLDIGIGEMTRLLAQTHRGVHQRADADLLRRSARLLRRAQEERKARSSSFCKKDLFKHHASFKGDGRRVARRPASASRENGDARLSSFSSGYGAGNGRVRCTGTRGYPNEINPPVEPYSGGGVRCSSRNRRPVSAKPALTCGSGWQPACAKAGREHGELWNRSAMDEADERRHSAPRFGELNDPDPSEVPSLNPHGIVEYDDEEEGPFNEDELEKVAASYFRWQPNSFRESSPVHNNHFVDDGSVYIYREGDGVEYEEANNNGVEMELCHGKHVHDTYWREECNHASSPERAHHEEHGGKSLGRTSGYYCNGERTPNPPRPTYDVIATGIQGGGLPPDKMKRITGASRPSEVIEDHINERLSAGERRKCSASVHHQRISDQTALNSNPRSLPGDVQPGGHANQHLGSFCPPQEIVPNLGYDQRTREPPETVIPEPHDQHQHGLEGYDEKNSGRIEVSVSSEAIGGERKIRRVADRLRQMILERQSSADRSMIQVFGHFDRRGCGYVNTEDMMEALTDLCLNLSPAETQEFLRMIALDGGDRISYAEFAVFVSDPDHAELQSKVCHQVSRQLGALGRRSFRLDEAFRQRQCWWSAAGTGARGRRADAQSKEGDHMFHESTEHRSEDKACRDRKEGYRQWQAVSASEFLDGLEILGLRLSATETERLLMRFDIHGDGHLSVGRFVSMIEKSPSWMCALDRLARQEEADEEADACLRAQRFSQGQPLNLEMVEMARYLGIRVSSDAHLLWIAADALAAPLPDGWVTQRTQEGMWFYHNEVTGDSRWDHPLDPHFRRLYLRERFGEGFEDAGDTVFDSTRHMKQMGTEKPWATDRGRVGRKVSSRPPWMLPPPRTRPNLKDFTSKKALESLQARRRNEVGREIRAETLAGTPGSALHRKNQSSTNRELLTSDDNLTGTTRTWRRRRPVSASVLHDGAPEKNDSLEALKAVIPAKRPECAAVSGMLGDPNIPQPAVGCSASVRSRRPRSAKATLQQPSKEQHSTHVSEEPQLNDRGQLQNMNDREPRNLRGDVQARRMDEWQESPQLDKKKGTYNNSGPRRGQGQLSSEHRQRSVKRATQHGERAPSTESESPSDHDTLISSDATDERAWMLKRLDDLCKRLSDAEAAQADQRRRALSRRCSRDSKVHRERSARSGSDLLCDRDSPHKSPPRKRRAASSGGYARHDGHQPASSNPNLRHHIYELEHRIRELETRVRDPQSHSHHLDHLRPHNSDKGSKVGRQGKGSKAARARCAGKQESRRNIGSACEENGAARTTTSQRSRSSAPSRRWSFGMGISERCSTHGTGSSASSESPFFDEKEGQSHPSRKDPKLVAPIKREKGGRQESHRNTIVSGRVGGIVLI